jgi:hypothetical protein
MARLILERVGGTDNDPRFGLRDAEDVKAWGGHNVIVCEVKGDKSKRTSLQNRAIHKFCGLLADKFNAAGLDMVTVLKEKETEVSWTMESVKDVIWRSIQLALFPDKPSTTQLETHEVTKVYEQIARHMSNRFNINQSFPNRHGD